ncbi:urease accessory protein UreD [Vibrio sp. ZSDZ65]|uniref:Urease accessory protein UreD n=1 Tax=Vibrio qingdaonensis TaxID=2829491 RepID=A0A9X3CM03_9VIBR|nr:urease accessory protein UreD [Vibrio qingdaonensis]MCW8345851.1 urease accessory protein UreD [Vibrio qingdaonensis]
MSRADTIPVSSLPPELEATLGQVIDAHTECGWKARLALTFIDRGDKTVLKHRSQQGPLAIQRPLYPEGNPCHSYLLHPPGGVVGGDTLQITVQAHQGAKTLITTPGATKFYRSESKYAKQQQTLHVSKDSRLEWLPQENIFFPDAHVRMDTRVHLETGAQFLGWEMHCFGRPALNEGYSAGHLIGKTEIYLDNQLLLSEGLNVRGDDKDMKSKGLLDYQMMGAVYISIDDDDFYQLVQSLLINIQQEYKEGAVLIAASQLDNLLVIRALGNWSEVILDCFQKVWQLTREHWTEECPEPPRIWAT